MRGSWIFLVIFNLSFCGMAQESVQIDYIRKHARLAVEEMELYKIPASITLSQGILETGGGQSRLAELANNHFGIKCKKEWTGPTLSHTDDAPNECFRAYASVQESYRDHSKFLAERPFYKNLFTLDLYDYQGWAKGLRKAGYATNPRYPQLLISSIEKYQLYQFDRLKPDEVEAKLFELFGPSDIIALSNYDLFPDSENIAGVAIQDETEENPIPELPVKSIKTEPRPQSPSQRIKKHPLGIRYVVANENETLAGLAALYKINPKKLAQFNELPQNGKLTDGQFVFLEKKKNKGATAHYKVAEGDNMYLIAQKTGMKIDKLYRLNRMKPGEQPHPGMTLNLKKRK